jgi:uncharacterized protein YlbG (UPF0298 family)
MCHLFYTSVRVGYAYLYLKRQDVNTLGYLKTYSKFVNFVSFGAHHYDMSGFWEILKEKIIRTVTEVNINKQ